MFTRFASCPAFTLVEMLVVMAVIAALIGLSGPAVNALKSSNDVNKAVYDMASILDQGRTYAMSNGTYVYVGFQEADANLSESGRQQMGVGRVNVAVIARKDGTLGYDVNDASSWSNNYGNGLGYYIIGKVQSFTNMHLANLMPSGSPPTTGGMARPTCNAAYNLADASCVSTTPFEYPLGSSPGGGTYTFASVIQFDPQGVARIQESTNADTIARRIEIGLEQTHGNVPVTTGNVAAIQIDGMTGSVHIFRP